MRGASLIPMVCLLGLNVACWKEETNEFPLQGVPWEPLFAEAPADWVIDTYDMPMLCPDGEVAQTYVVYPRGVTTNQPVAILFHHEAFGYVLNPDPANPFPATVQEHWGEEVRIEREWGARHAFMAIGMFPDPDFTSANPDAEPTPTGALAIELARAGVAMVVPSNCWGDMWANSPEHRANAESEHITRNGYAAAEFAWDLVHEDGFVADLQPRFDRDQVYLVGQGHGGRAVSELLATDHDPKALLVDSVADDLRAYWNNEEFFATTITGINRIFPDAPGSTTDGALFSHSGALPRTVYIYSSEDPSVPPKAHDAIAAKLLLQNNDLTIDLLASRHIATRVDFELAAQGVAHLTQ